MHTLSTLEQHLAAIVEGSDDAIITKDLNSVILTWNPGATRLFGYTPGEVIGRPITLIFPAERLDEEDDVIARLRRGERIAHFETVRKRKDGTLVPISLTVSPVRDADGRVIGASTIARDITLKAQHEERQKLILGEMKHRVANCFAVASGLLSIAARRCDSVPELIEEVGGRLRALAAVHSRTMSDPTRAQPQGTKLVDLVHSILEPFSGNIPITVELPDVDVCPDAITPLSLILFELSTNAVKYGGLSNAGEGLSIAAEQIGDRLVIRWGEVFGAKAGTGDPKQAGFGTKLCEGVVGASLDGIFSREFGPRGMTATMDLATSAISKPAQVPGACSAAPEGAEG